MKKKYKLFSPDAIATKIHQALNRDLDVQKQEYLETSSPLAYAKCNQAATFLKKYVPERFDKEPFVDDAHQLFLKANERMCDVNADLYYNLPMSTDRIQTGTSEWDRIHLRAQSLTHSILSDFTTEELFLSCKQSQGSSIGVSYNDTSMEAKWTFPITVTEGALPLLHQYLSYDSCLKKALEIFNKANPLTEGIEIVRGSRAATVDKSADRLRFINVEPTFNMFVQQGLMTIMARRMKAFGIDITTLPDEHKIRAKYASIFLHEATIDWRQASDLISRVLVEFNLPRKYANYFQLTHSPEIQVGDDWHEMHMISAMGNATTFPVETLMFWVYAQALHYTVTESPKTNTRLLPWDFPYKQCSVFGDDCIVPSFLAKPFINLMERLGSIVNDEKSFYGKVPFRESCGGDFLRGFDVRPFNLKAPESTRLSCLEPWMYIIMNRLLSKYISYFGSVTFLHNKALITSCIDIFKEYGLVFRVVPPEFPDDAGLKMCSHIRQLAILYPEMGFSPISLSDQGTYTFTYKRFVYKESKLMSPELRYFTWLKNPVISNVPRMTITGTKHKRKLSLEPILDYSVPTVQYKTKRKGGYVTAKAVTSHWLVPRLNVA